MRVFVGPRASLSRDSAKSSALPTVPHYTVLPVTLPTGPVAPRVKDGKGQGRWVWGAAWRSPCAAAGCRPEAQWVHRTRAEILDAWLRAYVWRSERARSQTCRLRRRLHAIACVRRSRTRRRLRLGGGGDGSGRGGARARARDGLMVHLNLWGAAESRAPGTGGIRCRGLRAEMPPTRGRSGGWRILRGRWRARRQALPLDPSRWAPRTPPTATLRRGTPRA